MLASSRKNALLMDEAKESNIRALFILIVGIHILLLYCTLSDGHDWGSDFAQYIMQAQSITEGKSREFIEVNRFTIEQSSYPLAPVAYPWGFPALLAPVHAVFGNSMIAFKSVGAIFFLLFLFCLFIGFRRYHSPFNLLLLICLFALNPYFLWHLDQIMSDMPFLLFSTVAVLLMGELIIARRRFVSPACDNIFLGAVIFAACSMRTTGILLLLTLGITQFISLSQRISRGEIAITTWRTALKSLLSWNWISVNGCLISFLPYGAFFGLSLLWNALLPEGGSSYTNQLGGITAKSIQDNLLYYVKLPTMFFSGPDGKLFPVGLLFYVLSLPCVIIGVIRRYRGDYHITVYVMLTLSLCIIWPAMQGLRFLFPVLPFYLSFVLTGSEALQGDSSTESTKNRSLRKIVNPVFVSLFLLWFGILWKNPYFNISDNLGMSSGPFTATAKSMFSFISENTERESVVIFFKPRVMRMMTGRKSILINKMEELERGDYLCLYRKTRYAQVSPDAIKHYLKRGVAQVVYENTDFDVYRLIKDKAASRDPDRVVAALHARR